MEFFWEPPGEPEMDECMEMNGGGPFDIAPG